MIPGSAERQLGNTGSRGWYSRGFLPHRDHPGLLQMITYRLADSVSSSTIAKMEAELRPKDARWQDVERRRWLERWLDAGYGSCTLSNPTAASCVVENWHRFAMERYDLIAWVVMPNHVHILVRIYEGHMLGSIVQSWKSYTGRKINQMLNEQESRAGARRSRGARSHGIWMREYWDRYIRDETHLTNAIKYIHMNPVKAGLAKREEDWPWSSARQFTT
jgi:REP element-mobilizing transposase RayT